MAERQADEHTYDDEMTPTPSPRSSAAEDRPDACANGHPLGPGLAIVGWMPCGCTTGRLGHRTVTCTACGAVWHHPAHVDDAGATWP